MASYITPDEAHILLSEHEIDALPTSGALELASDAADASGPFIGRRYSTSQARAFPRSVTIAGDTAGQVPERVERWVALEAYKLDVNEDPPVTSVSLTAAGSVTYATPKVSQASRLQKIILRPYQTSPSGVLSSNPLVRG